MDYKITVTFPALTKDDTVYETNDLKMAEAYLVEKVKGLTTCPHNFSLKMKNATNVTIYSMDRAYP
jgi:hypothetical protein